MGADWVTDSALTDGGWKTLEFMCSVDWMDEDEIKASSIALHLSVTKQTLFIYILYNLFVII